MSFNYELCKNRDKLKVMYADTKDIMTLVGGPVNEYYWVTHGDDYMPFTTHRSNLRNLPIELTQQGSK